MRKTIFVAALTAVAALGMAACHKAQDQPAADNTAAVAPADNAATAGTADNAMGNTAVDASVANAADAPPGRGDPTRQ